MSEQDNQYGPGYQVKDFIQYHNLDFFRGNVIKYICRKKGSDKEDNRKALNYALMAEEIGVDTRTRRVINVLFSQTNHGLKVIEADHRQLQRLIGAYDLDSAAFYAIADLLRMRFDRIGKYLNNEL